MSDDVQQEASSAPAEEVAEVTAVTPETPAVDYKSEAEKYRKIAEERLGALTRMQAARSRKEETPDEPEEDDSTVLKLVDERLNRFQTQAVLEDELARITDNPDERELVRLVYENDLKVSGATRDDVKSALRKALAIANLPKLEAQLREKGAKEVKASIAQDRTMSEGSMSGGTGRQPPKSETKVSPGQSKFMDFVEGRVNANKR
jgi:hypothetical protein